MSGPGDPTLIAAITVAANPGAAVTGYRCQATRTGAGTWQVDFAESIGPGNVPSAGYAIVATAQGAAGTTRVCNVRPDAGVTTRAFVDVSVAGVATDAAWSLTAHRYGATG